MALSTRRKILIGVGSTAAVAAGVAGGVWWQKFRPLPVLGDGKDGKVRDFRIKEDGSLPALVIAQNDDDPAALTSKALAAMGSMSRFVAKGDVVVVKPNAAWARTPLQAANTNPQVVATIVKAVLAAGAKRVIVTDRTCNEAEESFDRSGIAKAAADAGAEVILPQDSDFRESEVQGAVLGRWSLLAPLLDADKVINVPIAKHHSLAKFTGALKNWFGLLGGERGRLHSNIDLAIADLAMFIRPTLTVIDGTRVLLRNGPRGGDVKDTSQKNVIVASVDQVAADAYACTLIGQQPAALGYLTLAQERGAGTIDWQKLPHKLV